MYDTEYFTFPGSDGAHAISAYLCHPQGEPKAVLQISHGMCEYFENYTALIEAMCAKGYLVAGHDHLGHGKTAKDGELGYFADRGGDLLLVEDLAQMTRILRQKYPNLPLILLGHSMGSFIARAYMELFPTLADGVILSGTIGANPAIPVAQRMARSAVRQGKGRQPGEQLGKMGFLGYNRRFRPRVSAFDWLSSQTEVGQKYLKDPKRNFLFTNSGYLDLITLMARITRPAWARTVNHALPVLLVAGKQDPVGDYGQGPMQTYKRLKKAGVADVVLILYGHSRHEPHNDVDSSKEFHDLDAWITRRFFKPHPDEAKG